MTRIAIAHDYLTQRGGAERVVLAMARAFPDAPIYTTFYDPETTFPEFKGMDIRPARANRIGWLRHHHRAALPLLPWIASSIRIDADMVIASSSGWAHGFRTTGSKLFYCYSPARWLYQGDAYLGDSPNRLVRIALAMLRPWLKRWDRRAASTVNRFLAISTVVKGRILDAYGADSIIVPAPQTVRSESPSERIGELDEWLAGAQYFLCVSRLLPYKNVEQVVRSAALAPTRRFVVIGAGPEEAHLLHIASPNVLFLKNLTDAQMRTVYAKCTALIAASYEDFGLTPLEAASFGRPSVVLRWGGFLDTMVEDLTAVFFDAPEAAQIDDAVSRLESLDWDTEAIKAHAGKFSETVFAATLNDIVEQLEQETTSW